MGKGGINLKMKIVFFGTPDYVLPVLNTLHKKLKEKIDQSPFVAIVTQKPKPTGRKQFLTYSPVDNWAHKKGIPKYYSAKDLLKEEKMYDLGILASYGEIIPKSVIGLFKHGILNIHPSLLPRFKGASPIQATIISGDKRTGVTTISLDEKLDHGPIISQFRQDVHTNDTTESLRKRLFEKSAEVLVALVPAFIKGKIKPRAQNHKNEIFTRQIRKDDAFISPLDIKNALKGKSSKKKWNIEFIKDFSMEANPKNIERFIRSMTPWPIAWTKITVNKKRFRFKIINAHLERDHLVLDDVQLEGKNAVTWKQFLEGYPNAIFE